jgi:tRNA G46 methylase TrmB
MTGNGGATSSPVHSSQTWVHPQLGRQVRRHLASEWRKPPQAVDGPALAALDAALAKHGGPLILDSFCGTGHSTAALAKLNPKALVVGVDKSAARLSRHAVQDAAENCLLLRAHCEAVWRHLAQRGCTLNAHYLLYPNPWPKPAQLSRRVHGHPAFPLLLALGGELELRSNWQLYLEEFGVALHLAGTVAGISRLPAREKPITLFERKYRDSGHTLWRLRARLPGYCDGAP